jgi:hypothetical protein
VLHALEHQYDEPVIRTQPVYTNIFVKFLLSLFFKILQTFFLHELPQLTKVYPGECRSIANKIPTEKNH